jgi:phage FluMu gp28-like protein
VLTVARVVAPASDAIVQEPRLEVVEHLAVAGEKHDELFGRLVDMLGRVWRVRRVAVDATGLGETLARLLAKTLGPSVVRAVRLTAESKSRLGYNLLAAVNGGRLKMCAADGSAEYAEFWRQMELARAAYRPSRTMNFFVEPSRGHDDYLMSLALVVEAARDLDPRPRVARGRAGPSARSRHGGQAGQSLERTR